MRFHRVASALSSAAVLVLSGACSSTPQSEPSATDEAALRNCRLNPDACNPPNPCEAACDGSACGVVRVGARSCRCNGPCGGSLVCQQGACVAPPPTCSGPPPEWQTWWVPGAHTLEFRQLHPGEAPNPDTSCYSGCGPTAWAMFFAQVDTHYGADWTNDPSWFHATQSGDRVSFDGNYPQITIDISHHLGTSCAQPSSPDAYTEPTWMASAGDYFLQGPEAKYSPHGPLGGYTAAGMSYQYVTHNTDDSLLPDYLNDYGTLDYARDWIINHGWPVVYGYYVGAAVIGNAHYGLATGYREKATGWACQQAGDGSMQWVVTKSDNTQWQFYINGGGGDSDDWRSPAAYYVGTIKIQPK